MKQRSLAEICTTPFGSSTGLRKPSFITASLRSLPTQAQKFSPNHMLEPTASIYPFLNVQRPGFPEVSMISATRLALKHPSVVRGIHISAVVDPPLTPASPPLTDAEKAYKARAAQWEADEGAYEHVHCTKPQTLAFALADSPVGLASWILEKFHSWSDHGADLLQTFPADLLLDNLMMYWVTNCIGSSMRYYYDGAHFRPPFRPDDHVRVPTAICMWLKDLMVAPREWAERFYDVRQYTVQEHGGHFPAWEAHEAYASDLQSFARSLNDD